MTVDELLGRISSQELSRWRAYEHAFGPLGTVYADDLLAGIYEQLQAFNSDGKQQIPRHPRPHEIFERAEAMQEAPVAEPGSDAQAAQIAAFNAVMDEQ